MTSDDATVADVLDDLEISREVTPMFNLVMGTADSDDLDYEDWIRPMKLTDGRVCLRIDDEEEAGPFYIRRTGGEDLWAGFCGDRAGWKVTPGYLSAYLADPKATIEPVLLEDTPFAEVDDE